LCERLWQSGMMEESFIACHFSYAVRKQYEPKDFKVFEKWIEKYGIWQKETGIFPVNALLLATQIRPSRWLNKTSH